MSSELPAKSSLFVNEGEEMQASTTHAVLKILSYVILVLMMSAIFYAAYISAAYWTGIGV